MLWLDDMVGIAVRGVQPSYAREIDISQDIPHVTYFSFGKSTETL